jgi:hypothetical protein
MNMTTRANLQNSRNVEGRAMHAGSNKIGCHFNLAAVVDVFAGRFYYLLGEQAG